MPMRSMTTLGHIDVNEATRKSSSQGFRVLSSCRRAASFHCSVWAERSARVHWPGIKSVSNLFLVQPFASGSKRQAIFRLALGCVRKNVESLAAQEWR